MPPAETLVFRPRRLQIMVAILSVMLCAICGFGWVALPSSLRAAFTPFQIITLLAILAVILFIMIAAAASVVRVDEHQLFVRNGLRSYRLGWDRVHKVMLRPGDAWALMLLKPADGSAFVADLDAEKLQLIGIQATDGERATQAVAAIESLRTQA